LILSIKNAPFLERLFTYVEKTAILRYVPALAFANRTPVASRLNEHHHEYPIERKIGLSSVLAFVKASSHHGNQSTGLYACCKDKETFHFNIISLPALDYSLDIFKMKSQRLTLRHRLN